MDSSRTPKDAKSVSFNDGAGADGEMVALRGMVMGGRDEAGCTARVGAVDPPAKRALLRVAVALPAAGPAPACASRLPRGALLPSLSRPTPGLLLPPPAAAAAATWAAFLFFLSMAMGWPGKMCARAHLCPNLQLPFTNHVQVSFCPPGSDRLWEKGHDAPAVHPPTLKNLQGTWERSFAVRIYSEHELRSNIICQ